MSGITTHVLDLSAGRPAAGVAVTLERQSDGGWKVLGRAATDAGGRVASFTPAAPLEAGVYRLTFDTQAYFVGRGLETFYPQASVVFSLRNPSEHYHVPLLLSPFGYSTYRGS
jgi:5-hydroxyisourate hydrolase